MAREDPHSHADSEQPRARHLRLRLRVDFAARRIEGDATLELAAPAAGTLDLDSKALEILEASTGSGARLPFEVGPEEPILGSRLRLSLPAGTREVRLRYRTSPDAPALQWLSPEQTEGGKHPFLFSQCQPIHARSLVPLQDTARNRLTYEAEVEVPEPLARRDVRRPRRRGAGIAAGHARLPLPDAPADPALPPGARGRRLESRELGPRSRVFAEPETVEKAAHEFAETEAMIARAEELFGPYDWDRYDMLVLPPSFPYGGMENPRMTFLTPTLLAGDRSLVDVVAHELAHSWTGNLVTNADMEHFWLNEGFTVWAERRLLEALHGEEATVLAWAIGEKALEESMAALRARLAAHAPAHRPGRHGPGRRLLLRALREGRALRDPARADGGARALRPLHAGLHGPLPLHLDHHRGVPRVPRERAARARLPGGRSRVALRARAAGERARLPLPAARRPGGPRPGLCRRASDRPPPRSPAGVPPRRSSTSRACPARSTREGCAWLDAALGLTGRGNHEILVEWLTLAAGSDYEPAFARLREVLLRVGRMKYLRPLYAAMGRHPRTRALAREVFAEAAPRYHSLSRRVAASVIEKYDDSPAS